MLLTLGLRVGFILGVKFDSKLTFEDHVLGYCLSCLSKNWYFEVGEACLCGHLYVALLLRSLLLFVATINPCVLFSCVGFCRWMFQLLERKVKSVARVCPDQSFLLLCHWRYIAVLWMLYKVSSNSNHWLFSELLSASVRVRHTRAPAAAHPLNFGVSRCRPSQFARCFLRSRLVCGSNDLPNTVFDTGTLDGFKGAVNHWLLPWVVFSSFCGVGACGVAKAIYKQLCFPYLGLCCWF